MALLLPICNNRPLVTVSEREYFEGVRVEGVAMILWRRGLSILVGIVPLLLAGCGEEEAGLQGPTATLSDPTIAPAPTLAAGATLWRWVNVTLLVPDDGRFYVVQDSDPPEARPPDGGPVLKLYKTSGGDPSAMPESWVHLNAETGAVVRENIGEDDRAEIQSVLDTLSVAPLDVVNTKWPYSGELPPDLTRETFGGMSFIRPTPDTGLLVGGSISDPGGAGLTMGNGRSGVGVYIDEATGSLAAETKYILPEDEAAFMRWVDSVELCGSEIAC
jgi:hypothetical protein